MKSGMLLTILATYLLLLGASGYLAFFEFRGGYTLPNPQMIQQLAGDAEFKRDLLEDIAVQRQRSNDLSKLASHSFDVILGAILGFLSAVAVSRGVSAGGGISDGTEDRGDRATPGGAP